MSPILPSSTSRSAGLRAGRRTLKTVSALLQLGFLGMGLAVFLDRSRVLLSDAQFTHGERTVMGIVALSSLGGGALAGWLAARLIAVAADALDDIADAAESARRTNELIEGQVVPALLRIAAAVEPPRPSFKSSTTPTRPAKP